MPVNIIIGLLALLGALITYSIASWGAFRAKKVKRSHVILLWVGFFFDCLATAMMAIQAGGLDLTPLSDLLHTVAAFVAMFGMLVAAIVATMALSKNDDRLGASLARWVLAPWAFWVLMFLWGMVARGSARMG
jgi:uncharacterized repeat protein (TIGR03987 family)